MTSRPRIVLASVALVAVLVVGFAAWTFFGGEEPAPVDLETAVSDVAEDEGATGTSVADGEAAGGIDGTWTVDADTGDFDYTSATGTFVGFRIAEQLASVGATEAVGRTGDVTGSTTIDGTTLTDATFEADLTTITTNDGRRDDKVQQALETGQHPTATFALTEPVELGEAAADGGSVSVTATGDLTIHGVTREVEVPLEAQLVDGTIVVVATVDVTFSDYGVEVPSSPIVVSADDHGAVEMQLLLTR